MFHEAARVRIGLIIVLAALALPSAASAKSGSLSADLVAPPTVKGSKVIVPALLSNKTQKKLKLSSPLARLSLKGSKPIEAPAPGGGTTQIAPSSLRPGDAVAGRVSFSKKAAKLDVPTLKTKSLRVSKRESAFSNDELTGIVFALAVQLVSLSGRVDALSASTAAGFANLQSQLDALTGRIAALETGLADLQAALTALDDRLTAAIDALGADLDDLRADLTALQADVQNLLTRVTDLEAAVAQIESLIDDLTTRLTTVEDAVAVLQTQIGVINTALTDLTTRLAALEALDLPGAIADIMTLFGLVGDLDTSLQALDGRVDTIEGALALQTIQITDLTGRVDTLETSVTGLTSTVGTQGTEISTLQGDVSALTSALAGVDGDLGTVEDELALLQGQVGGLDGDLTSAQADIATLCATVNGLIVPLPPVC